MPPTLDAVLAFTSSLPIRKLPGVGRVAERLAVAASGGEAATCGGVLRSAPRLHALLSPSLFDTLFRGAMGIGETEHPRVAVGGEEEPGRAGMSVERTFAPVSGHSELSSRLREICATLAAHLAAEGLRCKSLTLKLKTAEFELRTRTHTFPGAGGHTADDATMWEAARRLLEPEMARPVPISPPLFLFFQ